MGRKKKLLPGVLADAIAEQGLVVPSLQLKMARFLFIGPTRGQVGRPGQVGVNQLAIPHGGPNRPVAQVAQGARRC